MCIRGNHATRKRNALVAVHKSRYKMLRHAAEKDVIKIHLVYIQD